ncbi:phage protein [Microbulbifer taiwanensis]|uniref:Phage protein n=1 Tax=Microbulbifer taiwanensis TaxID=986746 RepID=A0ABW1YLA7_9GAMM|nr:phage protein [Microbulbifer taiwanensis]
MGQKLTGKDVDVMIGSYMVHIEEISITIDDATAPTKTRGIPDGFIAGEVSASGEVKLNTSQFQVICDAAKEAGSFRKLPTFDVVMNAETTDEKINVEAFDCKFRLSELLNANQSGSERLMHTLPYDVTGSDFVRINGVPYVDASETENFN